MSPWFVPLHPAVVVAAVVVAAVLVGGSLAVRAAAVRAGHPLVPARVALVRPVAVSVLVAALLFLVSGALPGVVVTGVSVALVAAALVRPVPEILRSIRLHRELDAALAQPTLGPLDVLLGERTPPFGFGTRAQWAGRLLVAAARAHTLGYSERAFELLERADLQRLGGAGLAAYCQLRVAVAFATRRRTVARETLRLAPVTTGRADLDAALAYQRALLAVLDGDVSDARLAEAERAREASTGWLVAAWRGVEAHALVARGDEPGARMLLETMLLRGDLGTIVRLARHDGPASALAQRVIDASPYR